MSETNTVSPLRQRMLEDMAARKLNPHTQRSHISSCKRFAAWLKQPTTAESRFAGRTIMPTAKAAGRPCGFSRRSSSGAF